MSFIKVVLTARRTPDTSSSHPGGLKPRHARLPRTNPLSVTRSYNPCALPLRPRAQPQPQHQLCASRHRLIRRVSARAAGGGASGGDGTRRPKKSTGAGKKRTKAAFKPPIDPSETTRSLFKHLVAFLEAPGLRYKTLNDAVESCRPAGASDAAFHHALRRLLLFRDLGVVLQGLPRAKPQYHHMLLSVRDSHIYAAAALLHRYGMGELLQECPETLAVLLSCNTEKQLRPTVQHLLSLGLTPEEVSRLLTRHPRIVHHSVEAKQKPLVALLGAEFGISREEAGKMLLSSPSIVGHSLKKPPCVAMALQEALGWTPEEAGHALRRCPVLLTMSVDDNLRPTLVDLEQQLSLDRERLSRLVATVPKVLTLNLSPTGDQARKIRFVSDVMQLEPAAIADCPVVLTLSLERRLAPRVMFMLHCGMDVSDVSLTRAFIYKDQQFSERTVGRPLEEFRAFQPMWRSAPEWAEWLLGTNDDETIKQQ